MHSPACPRAVSVTVGLVLALLMATAGAASAAGGPRGTCKPARACADVTAPILALSTPVSGAVLASSFSVTGTATDDRGVASVSVRVDSGSWQKAVGTSSWTLPIVASELTEGSHALAAQATDTSGNLSQAASVTITVDRTAPAVVISAPTAGGSTSGLVSVAGSASDTGGVAAVDLSVDGGAWHPAVGTASWSLPWDTTTVADGGHTLVARATDRAGLTQTSSVQVQVLNQATTTDSMPPSVQVAAPTAGSTVAGAVTVDGASSDDVGVARVDVKVDAGTWSRASGTASWAWSWDASGAAAGSHSLTARATDTSGNVTAQTISVTVAAPSSPPPATQGTWTSPEGVQISVDSAGPWTISTVYDLLRANARNLQKLGPALSVRVLDDYASMTQSSAVLGTGGYGGYSATITLQGVNSGFAARPNDVMAHEYGHAWSMYAYYVVHRGSWDSYLTSRWTTGDGSQTLATDSRTGSTYNWNVGEILADDYRLLFGSPQAVTERPAHLNSAIPAPSVVPGLATAMTTWWG